MTDHDADQPTPDHTAGDSPDHIERGKLPSRKVVSADEASSLSRRAILTGGVAIAAGALGVRQAVTGRSDEFRGTTRMLRASYEFNEDVWRRLTDPDRLAPEFDFAESAMPIVNGRRGIEDDVDVDAWRLEVQGPDGEVLRELSIDEIKQLPFTETIFEFKCIEGWSEVTAFGGVRVRDFISELFPGRERHEYVGMDTSNGEYPVALDMQTLMQPQTVLAWEMQRAPLTQGHGAPLRLATPLKYGIKNIRRPATFQFTDERPPDFWGMRTYSDWVGL